MFSFIYLNKKKELYKLLVARSDILAAHTTCDYFLANVKDMKHQLYFPLQSAIIVSYGRPFSDNKPLGPLKNKWGKFQDQQLQKMHNDLLELRNKMIAHSDHEHRKAHIIPKGASHPVLGKIKRLSASVSSKALPIERFQIIRRLCFDLNTRLNQEADKQLEELFENKDLPPKEFELSW